MKNLVKKIALPGAILAFAMALFGVSAYAEETFTKWEEHIQGSWKQQEIKRKIEVLLKRIQTLKGQKKELENALKEVSQTSGVYVSDSDVSNVDQVKQKIEDVKRKISEKDSEISRLESEKGKMIDSSQATTSHNGEMKKAWDAMDDILQQANKADEDTYKIPNHE